MPEARSPLAAAEAALEFIREYPHVYLLAYRPDGFPTGYAMMAQVNQGGIEFSTYRSSAKVRYLLEQGVAGVLAAAESPGDDRVLFVEGRVTLADTKRAPSERQTAVSSGVDKFTVPEEITEKVAARHESGKRCILRVVVERVVYSSGLS
jgi:hypothetical protein